jgi:4-hydroxybenzoate polyprenyltransferase
VPKLPGLLRLTRPANIVTAISDILAGISIAVYSFGNNWNQLSIVPVFLLIISTIGLYGGGVVFNDVFDTELDKVERPERPIPSGLISLRTAILFASILLFTGIAAASIIHSEGLFSVSSFLAIAIAVAAIVYDRWGKHHNFLGPLNMGFCRGLNLLLGMSIFPSAVQQYWFIGFVPVLYIAAITMISRGEVHGGNKNTLYGAALMYFVVITSIVLISFINNTLVYTMVFLLLFAILIFPPLLRAIHKPTGAAIGKSVKAGVIALIAMNAAWAACFGAFYFALLIVLLLPLSLLLAKLFAVT